MNLNEKQIREKYKEFYGNNNEQMKLLIKDNRVPMTFKQIIERRLNSDLPDWNNYFDTCDAIVYGDGKFKIVKDCKMLKDLTKETKIKNGGIEISKEQYNKIKAKEYDKDTDKSILWKELIEELYEPYINKIGFIPNFYVTNDKYLIKALYVLGLGVYGRSDAYGGGNLDDDNGRLVGVAPEALE